MLRFALALQWNLCYTPSLLTASNHPILGSLFKHLQLGTETSFRSRGVTKNSWVTPTEWSLGCRRPRRAKVVLDDSWSTHAMAGLVLVSPLGVWGALAAAHALLQLTATGHFAFDEPALLWLPPATLLDSGSSATHHRQLTKRPSTRSADWGHGSNFWCNHTSLMTSNLQYI